MSDRITSYQPTLRLSRALQEASQISCAANIALYVSQRSVQLPRLRQFVRNISQLRTFGVIPVAVLVSTAASETEHSSKQTLFDPLRDKSAYYRRHKRRQRRHILSA